MAVFSGKLPSMEAEIDCKLLSNSRISGKETSKDSPWVRNKRDSVASHLHEANTNPLVTTADAHRCYDGSSFG